MYQNIIHMKIKHIVLYIILIWLGLMVFAFIYKKLNPTNKDQLKDDIYKMKKRREKNEKKEQESEMEYKKKMKKIDDERKVKEKEAEEKEEKKKKLLSELINEMIKEIRSNNLIYEDIYICFRFIIFIINKYDFIDDNDKIKFKQFIDEYLKRYETVLEDLKLFIDNKLDKKKKELMHYDVKDDDKAFEKVLKEEIEKLIKNKKLFNKNGKIVEKFNELAFNYDPDYPTMFEYQDFIEDYINNSDGEYVGPIEIKDIPDNIKKNLDLNENNYSVKKLNDLKDDLEDKNWNTFRKSIDTLTLKEELKKLEKLKKKNFNQKIKEIFEFFNL